MASHTAAEDHACQSSDRIVNYQIERFAIRPVMDAQPLPSILSACNGQAQVEADGTAFARRVDKCVQTSQPLGAMSRFAKTTTSEDLNYG